MMRVLLSALASVIASGAVLAALIAVNGRVLTPPEPETRAAIAFDVATPQTPPPTPRPRPRPRRQRAQSDAPAAPILSAGLGGLDLGLGTAGLGSLGAEALLDTPTDVVMTAGTVDQPPRPLERMAPEYPSRARARGIEGRVTVSLHIDANGRVTDARVLDASPAGVFDDAALSAVRRWSFEPAQYEGRAVAIRVEQAVRFTLR
jgi:protein TonB